MKTIKLDGVLFKGQYAEQLESLLDGNTITMHNFYNGKW